MKTTFVKREIDSVPQNAGYSWLERIVVDYSSMCVEVYEGVSKFKITIISFAQLLTISLRYSLSCRAERSEVEASHITHSETPRLRSLRLYLNENEIVKRGFERS